MQFIDDALGQTRRLVFESHTSGHRHATRKTNQDCEAVRRSVQIEKKRRQNFI
jgi:hypothetical protein